MRPDTHGYVSVGHIMNSTLGSLHTSLNTHFIFVRDSGRTLGRIELMAQTSESAGPVARRGLPSLQQPYIQPENLDAHAWRVICLRA